jgi:hypothetical protein
VTGGKPDPLLLDEMFSPAFPWTKALIAIMAAALEAAASNHRVGKAGGVLWPRPQRLARRLWVNAKLRAGFS